jgi:hypothetical protein
LGTPYFQGVFLHKRQISRNSSKMQRLPANLPIIRTYYEGRCLRYNFELATVAAN